MKHSIKKLTLLSLVLSLSQTIISVERKAPKVSLITKKTKFTKTIFSYDLQS